MTTSNTNTSASGGYLLPQEPSPPTLPQQLSFNQFLQTVIVGISGLNGSLVRPRWQRNPPKQPNPEITWIAYGVTTIKSDTNAFVGMDDQGNTAFQRQEEFEVMAAFYGPLAQELCQEVRDGFQIGQNREALLAANMNFVSTGDMLQIPDLVDEEWIDKWEMTITMRREINRVYPILNFLSVSGTISAELSTDAVKIVPWSVNPPES